MRLLIDTSNISEWMTMGRRSRRRCWNDVLGMCFLGLPSLLIALAPNQESVADAAGRMGIACNLGKQGEVSAATIAEKLAALLNSVNCRNEAIRERPEAG